jgi:type VI secretion system protein ImpG
MDPRLLRYYNQELQYIRESGAEFAQEFPKIASRLGMDGMEVADPYVERLLEGFAFLTARIQLKLDAEFPKLSQRLLEMIYPNFTAPMPSMMVARFFPKPGNDSLNNPVLKKGSRLSGPKTAFGETRCEFRTGNELKITAIEVTGAEYFVSATDLPLSSLTGRYAKPRAGIRLKLTVPADVQFSKLKQDELVLFLSGTPEVAFQIYEAMAHHCLGFFVGASDQRKLPGFTWNDAEFLKPLGSSDEEALLPINLRGFSGLRLVQEFFAFPQRFMFFKLSGLASLFERLQTSEVDLCLIFSTNQFELQGLVSAQSFSTNCVTAINLFERRSDRVQVVNNQTELQLVPDRSAPLDYEVYDVLEVSGYSSGNDETPFYPFFSAWHEQPQRYSRFYNCLREPRVASEKVKLNGPRSGYVGSEVFVQLVDEQQSPYAHNLKQLACRVRCTNRDLPLFMPLGSKSGDFTVDDSLPIESIHSVAGPSRPFSSIRDSGVSWQLVNLLSMNYLSILNADPTKAATVLRELIRIIAKISQNEVEKFCDGIVAVKASQVVRRIPLAGPIAFGRGLLIELTVDEMAFEGSNACLFGRVMSHYFERHVSINSFAETVIISNTRGEIARFKPRMGERPIL